MLETDLILFDNKIWFTCYQKMNVFMDIDIWCDKNTNNHMKYDINWKYQFTAIYFFSDKIFIKI